MKKRPLIIAITVVALCFAALFSCGKGAGSGKAETDYMVLVSKKSALPDDWDQQIELVDVYTSLDETYRLEKKTAEAFARLKAAMAEEHVIIELDSAYRTVQRQQEIWDQFMVKYGEEYTKTYVAVPGTSEHHTGLALDVKLVKDGKIIDDNDEMTAETELFSKVHARLAEFGFILRYPKGKEEITGFGAEVWHFRYIDDPAIAKEIMDKGITLEEYLEQSK